MRPKKAVFRIHSMGRDIFAIFKEIYEPNPAKKLEFLVLEKISLKKRKEQKMFLALTRLGITLSSLALAWGAFYLGKSVWESDFSALFSLLFSDAIIVASNWKDFAFSLLENLPIFPILFFLFPLIVLFFLLDFHLKKSSPQQKHFFTPKFNF